MTLFAKGNTEWKKKGIPGTPKEQSPAVKKKRILDWMEWTTGRNRKAIGTFFHRNGIEFEPKEVSTYIAASRLNKGGSVLLSDIKSIESK